jgi:hypothetical protein
MTTIILADVDSIVNSSTFFLKSASDDHIL